MSAEKTFGPWGLAESELERTSRGGGSRSHHFLAAHAVQLPSDPPREEEGKPAMADPREEQEDLPPVCLLKLPPEVLARVIMECDLQTVFCFAQVGAHASLRQEETGHPHIQC